MFSNSTKEINSKLTVELLSWRLRIIYWAETSKCLDTKHALLNHDHIMLHWTEVDSSKQLSNVSYRISVKLYLVCLSTVFRLHTQIDNTNSSWLSWIAIIIKYSKSDRILKFGLFWFMYEQIWQYWYWHCWPWSYPQITLSSSQLIKTCNK